MSKEDLRNLLTISCTVLWEKPLSQRKCWISSKREGSGWGCLDGTFLSKVDKEGRAMEKPPSGCPLSGSSDLETTQAVASKGQTGPFWVTGTSLDNWYPFRSDWEKELCGHPNFPKKITTHPPPSHRIGEKRTVQQKFVQNWYKLV